MDKWFQQSSGQNGPNSHYTDRTLTMVMIIMETGPNRYHQLSINYHDYTDIFICRGGGGAICI